MALKVTGKSICLKMEESKLAKILSTFTPGEFKDFGKFLRSPYHNQTERNLEGFFEIIRKSYPDFNISKENIYRKLYAGKPYNEKTIKNIFTDTYKMAEDFLTINKFYSKKEFEANLRAEALLEKNLENEYLKAASRTEEILNTDKMGGEDYFINYRRYHQHKMTYSKSFYKDKSETGHILQSIEYLAALLLKDLSNLLVNKQLSVYLNTGAEDSQMLNMLLENFDIDKFMLQLEEINHKFYPYIAFRYYLYKDLCEQENFEYFYKLKEIVYKYMDEFSRETQFEASWAIINSCAMTSRRANTEMRRESLNMLKLQLEKGLHIAPGNSYYSTPAFNQLLAEALYFKEFDFVKSVIEKHSGELEPGIREEMKHWGYASLYFDKHDYELALSYASKINFREPNFKVQVKFLLFKIFYEMDLTEQALSIINTSMHALKLEDLSKEVRNRYITSFKNSVKLVKIKNNYSIEDAELFKRKINPQTFIGKKWILNKIDELAFSA
jgi:hypothetical protein